MRMNEEENVQNILTKDDVGATVIDFVVTASAVIFVRGDFYIFACKNKLSVKGKSSCGITVGASYKVTGTVGLYSDQLQINASSIDRNEDEISDNAIIANFLKENFEGIGVRNGAILAKKYGVKVLSELVNNPKKCSDDILSLSSKRALEISQHIDEDLIYFEVLLELNLLGLTNSQAKSAYDSFGQEIVEKIKMKPFILMHVNGIGFDTCEKLASKFNIDRFDLLRMAAAIEHVLIELHLLTGNTFINCDELKRETSKLVFEDNSVCKSCPQAISCNNFSQGGRIDEDTCPLFISAFENAFFEKKLKGSAVLYRFNDEGKCVGCNITDDNVRIAASAVFGCEVSIKQDVEAFLDAKTPGFDEDLAISTIEELSVKTSITPDSKQTQALLMCMHEPFSIITGGPGTGKTTITGILAAHFKSRHVKCVFCAPTGRAAKRLSEAVGYKAQTIHRLLGVAVNDKESDSLQPFPNDFGFNREELIDARVVIVDEASMVDIFLFKALLKAIRKDASIILIGDPNQLPSVGPGNLLSDLLLCKSIPRVELEYVFRTDDESSIASNAYRILSGNKLIANDTDFQMINVSNDEDGYDRLLQIYSDEIKNSDVGDVAILCPTKQNGLGSIRINTGLQKMHEDSCDVEKLSISGRSINVGDRVMQVRNNYRIEYFDSDTNSLESGMYNGEIGTVSMVNPLDKSCKIRFDDGKEVHYEGKSLEDVEIAYAMTVHKSQGCEFDTVIIALGKMSIRLMDRKLLYTAVTRGKKRVIIINSGSKAEKMAASHRASERKSSLGELFAAVDARRGMSEDEKPKKRRNNRKNT